MDEFARLLDLRLWDPVARDTTLTTSEESGNLVSRSYSLPTTPDELRDKFAATEWWMRESLGPHGRAPDFMANVVVGLRDYHAELDTNEPSRLRRQGDRLPPLRHRARPRPHPCAR
ncbi:4-hydroxyphenylacetate 3-hydroxylase N-terminal domain-containing protein [Prescottella equi]|uniref:4-hydroxyphenylacetate 3-hydroxylase N-terminal domain-containing protein n=1 Tax=Rhodococcus hoagii TaxID=43767 RepID=UPI000A22E7D7|nr:4-hydroxyphenylacetate 3-hydroxylase N-terminal domain-containing protein [Prescottella equi]ORJ93708.1 hypothetical protein A6F58_18650 [Prescottella equi]